MTKIMIILSKGVFFVKTFYLCHDALILSGNNNWPPTIDLVGGFFIFVKRHVLWSTCNN